MISRAHPHVNFKVCFFVKASTHSVVKPGVVGILPICLTLYFPPYPTMSFVPPFFRLRPKNMVVERIVDAKIRVEKERKVKDEAAGAAGAGGVDASGAASSEVEAEAAATAAAAATGSGKRSKRCGICVGCRAKSCDQCKYCRDSKKNNGPNKLKQPCIKRRCRNLPGDAIDWTVSILVRNGNGNGNGNEMERTIRMYHMYELFCFCAPTPRPA